MDRIQITGGQPLQGEIEIGGANNAALPLMAASLLTAQCLTLRNLPIVADIHAMSALLAELGAGIELDAAERSIAITGDTVT